MRSLFTLRFDLRRTSISGHERSRDVLMVFVSTPELDPETFASTVEAEMESNLVPDEVAIVVRDPSYDEILAQLRSNSLHISTLGRLSTSTVTLVGYDCNGRETRRSEVTEVALGGSINLDDVRRRGVTFIFNERRGFVEANSTYHFENPSGRHTERFIRLSNILARSAEIAFVGFCCLPHVDPTVRRAYLDTPSLYGVVAAINEQRRSFPDTEWILAENFSSYTGFDDYEFDEEAAVVLISASSSGSLAARLVAEKNIEPQQIIHLLYLGRKPSPSPVVCDLSKNEEANPDGVTDLPSVNEAVDCAICASGSHAIKLQGDQFEFAGPQHDSLLVGVADAPKGLSQLMSRYACDGVFGVGLGRGGSKSPRLFHVDSEKLIANNEFATKLDYALRRSLPASLSLVIAADDQSRPLAEMVASRLANPAPVVARDEIDSIPKTTKDAIAIVASVIESGRTLLDVSRDLRSIAPEAPLIYLVGMAKTTGEPKRDRLDSSLTQTHNLFPYQVVTVDQIVLPASHDRHAWSAELQLLVDPEVIKLVPAGLERIVRSRVDRLRRASEALGDDLFAANADEPLSLQPGFVFWPKALPSKNRHRQADVYFTIASVLQRLRANAAGAGDHRIISNWFQQTMLAPGNFGRFNDDIIQASLLRAAYPHELNYADAASESREMGRLLRRIISACESPRGGAASEFLLALATRRMQLRQDDLDQVLEMEIPEVPMVRFLLDTCRHRLD